MKYLILTLLLSSTCIADTYTISRHELEEVCVLSYLQAVTDFKKYIPLNVRQKLIMKATFVDTCVLLIQKDVIRK